MAETSNTEATKPPATKVVIKTGSDEHTATCTLYNEDHTLANALRWMVSQDEDVELVGYSIPHPSEPNVVMRIQTHAKKPGSGRAGATARDVLSRGLDNLVNLCDVIAEEFKLQVGVAAPQDGAKDDDSSDSDEDMS